MMYYCIGRLERLANLIYTLKYMQYREAISGEKKDIEVKVLPRDDGIVLQDRIRIIGF